MIRSEWMAAHERNADRVAAHPLFPALVHAYASDGGNHAPGWRYLVRNSRTYGSWMTRGNPVKAYPYHSLRTLRLAKMIQDDLKLLPDSPPVEGEILVRSIAREWVDARQAPKRRTKQESADSQR